MDNRELRDFRNDSLSIEVRNNDVEMALKILKRRIKKSRLMVELQKREYYKKPSTLRKEKKAKERAKYKWLQLNDELQ